MTKIVSVQSDGHTLFECGLGFDSRFRPTDNRGKTYATNLYAAGSILCGYNYHVEKSGLGVALATGRAVGKYATESTKEVSS